MAASVRRWCLTENCLPLLLVHGLQEEGLPDGVKYFIGQLEKAPDTGKLHLQGYVELAQAKRLPWLKENLSRTAHWEAAKGSQDENRAYCSKDQTRQDGPWEFGVPAAQGKRTDLLEAKAAMGTSPPPPSSPPLLLFYFGSHNS